MMLVSLLESKVVPAFSQKEVALALFMKTVVGTLLLLA
jgi:hypothetical protein